MAQYKFRCPNHGDFLVEQPMAETSRAHNCTACLHPAPKVLGGALQFTYGRANFHSGPTGDGMTVRETQKKWLEGAKARGLEVEGVGYRHI